MHPTHSGGLDVRGARLHVKIDFDPALLRGAERIVVISQGFSTTRKTPCSSCSVVQGIRSIRR